MSEKSHWCVTNRHPVSQVAFGVLCLDREKELRENEQRAEPIPVCQLSHSLGLSCLLQDRAANIYTLHDLLHQAAETLIRSNY